MYPMYKTIPAPYIPPALRSEFVPEEVPEHIKEYIDTQVNSLRIQQQQFETFEKEDIRPNMMALYHDLKDTCVQKTGGQVVGPLHILTPPTANYDATNKEYVDWLFTLLKKELETKVAKNFDLDLNYFKIKNVQTPTTATDGVNKEYVDTLVEKFDVASKFNHIFSKGQILAKKTFFFNPGFICPQKINITAVGLCTSPNKFNIGEISKKEPNPTKLFVMINNTIRTEYMVEKDQQLGYVSKEFDPPIELQKGDNVMLVVESVIEDSSATLTFN